MTGLINGIYPLEYFQLSGVDPISFPNESWWASSERYAMVDPSLGNYFKSPERGGIPSTEYQEIDLGRVREVNLLTFDIAKMPIDIVVQYDALSSSIDAHKWVDVVPVADMPFDRAVNYEANARNVWKASQFHFTDAKGRIVHTRYLRIAYTRRYDFWPTRETNPFPYSIFVKNLRTARYITGHADTIGPLFEVDIDTSTLKLPLNIVGDATSEVRQRFVYPENARRGNITPALVGASVLVDVEQSKPELGVISENQTVWQWSLVEVSDLINPKILDEGIEHGVPHVGKCWLDIQFKRPVEGSLAGRYELRLKSLRASRSSSVYIHTPNNIPGDLLPGTFDFTSASSTVAYSGTGLADLINVGDSLQIVGTSEVLVADAVSSSSLTLSAPFGSPTVSGRSVVISQSLYAPARVGRQTLIGTVDFVNGDTTLDYDAAIGDQGLTHVSPDFVASIAVPLGHTIYPAGSAFTFVADNAGTTGGSAPVWPGTVGATVTSGDVTFRNAGINTRLLSPGDYIQSVLPGAPLAEIASVTNSTLTLTAPYIGETEAAASATRLYSLAGDITRPSPAEQRNTNLVMRIWADVADSGRDVLGNAYRYGVHRDSPARVFDGEMAGWMSAPQPSPEAVEALYFDVRGSNKSGTPILSVLDGLNIAPRTPGVRMQVYYNKEAVSSRTPETDEEWDHLMWTPINEIYVLRKDNAIELPESVKAAFVKLEFTNLRPLPFKLPSFPELPPVEFRRYPTWVEDQFMNTKVRRTVEDWFLQNAQPVQIKVLETLRSPIQEFAFKQRAFLTALAQGQLSDPRAINNGLVDVSSRTFVDPVTASKIYLGSNSEFRGMLMAAIKGESVLGRSVRNRYDSTNSPLAQEANFVNQRRTVPMVSSIGSSRINDSFSTLAETPMWFNRKCRHLYRIEKARFNKKAYFVGIRSLSFIRNDYTVEHDDAIIEDTFHDDAALEINTFTPEVQTTIPDGGDLVAAGVSPINVFVSYTIRGERFTDEPQALFGHEHVTLTGVGAPATDIRVHSDRNSQGVEYGFGNDYITAYDTDGIGNTTNTIGRSSLSERMVVPDVGEGGQSHRDAYIVTVTFGAAEALYNEDAAIVEINFFASAFNPHDYYDGPKIAVSATPLIGTGPPSGGLGSEDDQYVNTDNQGIWVKLPDGWALSHYVSSINLTASAPPVTQETHDRYTPSLDDPTAATVTISFEASASEIAQFVESATVGVTLEASGEEERQSEDGGTVTMSIGPVYDTMDGIYGASTYESEYSSYDDLRGFEDMDDAP